MTPRWTTLQVIIFCALAGTLWAVIGVFVGSSVRTAYHEQLMYEDPVKAAREEGKAFRTQVAVPASPEGAHAICVIVSPVLKTTLRDAWVKGCESP